VLKTDKKCLNFCAENWLWKQAILFWAKIFNVLDPIQHDFTNFVKFVEVLLKFLIFRTLKGTLI